MLDYRVFTGFVCSAILLLSSSTGSQIDRTGSPLAFGTCDACHVDGNFAGTLSLNGIPPSIGPNDTVDLELKVSGTDAVGAGFQIVALDNSTPQNYVGKWIVGLGSKKASTIGLTHSQRRGFVNNEGEWNFKWVSPSSGGLFTFYYVVNLTDSDGTTSGDNPILGSSQIILPVKFSEFRVFKDRDHIGMTWQTSEVVNNDYFEVQKMSSEGKFITIAKIPDRKGNNDVYYFQDKHPQNGLNYYRIKQVDRDKKFSFSDIQSIDFYREKSVIFYNPHTNTIEFPSVYKVSEIRLYDLNGRFISSSSRKGSLEVNDLSNGIYIVTANVNGQYLSDKIFIHH